MTTEQAEQAMLALAVSTVVARQSCYPLGIGKN
jgi:hypothetical protein